jgi:hypothetical protein
LPADFDPSMLGADSAHGTFPGPEAMLELRTDDLNFVFGELAALADLPGHSVRDVAIVRFDKKKDHRERQTTSGGSAFTYKARLQ